VIIIADLNLFADNRNLSWVLPDEVTSQLAGLFPTAAQGPAGRQSTRVYLPPPWITEVGYRGMFLTSFDGEVDGEYDHEHREVPRVQLTTRTAEHPDPQLVRRIFDSFPDQEMLGLTYEQLIAPTSGPYPILGLTGPARTVPLVCPSAPVFPVEPELSQWNSSLANCYGYANNKVGKCLPGSGALIKPTIPGVKKMLKSYDRLRFHGMGDPTAPLNDRIQTSYIAVCLRGPIGNSFSSFHCLRLDHDGLWSDKDGRLPVQQQGTPTLYDIRTSPQLTLAGVFVSQEGRRRID